MTAGLSFFYMDVSGLAVTQQSLCSCEGHLGILHLQSVSKRPSGPFPGPLTPSFLGTRMYPLSNLSHVSHQTLAQVETSTPGANLLPVFAPGGPDM